MYGLTHALVDATCAAVLFAGSAENRLGTVYFISLVILYNVLAFALQPPLGFLADKARKPVAAAVIGCLLTALSAFALELPVAAVCLAGAGNALFHIGGGIVSLNLKLGKAAMPGIYVAPGALGLLVGTLVGRGGYFAAWPFVILLFAAVISISLIKLPVINYDTVANTKVKTGAGRNTFELIILLLLASIAVRGLVGLVLDFPWKTNIYLLVALTLAVVLGKALGGILADRFGWMRVAAAGLLIAAPLISFGLDFPVLAILGVFFFNLTMPVTLVAISGMLPGRAGFAFGLSALALVIGAMPTFTTLRIVLYNQWVILAIIAFSAVILYKGLKLMGAGWTK